VRLDGRTREYGDGRFKTFAAEYFSPKHYMSGDLRVTDKTVAVHHYASTWHSWPERVKADFTKFGYGVLGEERYAGLERKIREEFE
jgi:cyclopropane fatty-acyl-phospholipid synthase-like methyltransferase